MTDIELIQGIKAGCEESLGLLIDRYGSYVAAVISGVSRGRISVMDTEELTADVFLAFWRSAADFDETRTVKPYLARIARNAAISRFRENSGSGKDCCGEGTLSLEEGGFAVEKDMTDELAFRREQETILNESVAGFQEPDREIFIRFYFLNEKLELISRRLEIKTSTVKTKLRRCRLKLRQAFEERGYTYYEG